MSDACKSSPLSAHFTEKPFHPSSCCRTSKRIGIEHQLKKSFGRRCKAVLRQSLDN